MANTIQVKRSAVAGKVPTTSDLALGELAINTYDGKLYLKKDDGTQTVVEVGGGGGGSGDVVGPASSTDNAITRFDGTTGKLIQNSTATLSDDGTFANVNAVGFDTTPSTIPTADGSLYWDSADGIQTLNLVMAGGDVVQQIGEETYYRIKASSAITNGQVVMFTGTVGASGGLTGAPATGLTAATAYAVMGIATEDIALNGWGYVTSFGLVRGIDTSAFSDGQILYLNPSVAGGLTATVPSAPNPKVQVCAVVYAAGNGSLFVRPSFGGTLGQFEGDVDITSPASGNTLVYNASAGKWVNANLTDGTGISITEGAGTITVTNTDLGSSQNIFKNFAVSGQSTIVADSNNDTLTVAAGTGVSLTTNATTDTLTITNTAPDQTVALTAGTGISTSGTYPNFTITNTAPDQTVALTAGTGIQVTGTYPNFTVTNTSPSSGGTVTSVGLSVPTGLSVSGSPVTSSGTIAISYTAGYSIPTTASQTNWDTAYSDRLKWDGGSTGLTASTGRTSLGATTLGSNLFTITNPSAVTFPRFNADNTVSALDAATFRTAIGAGTSSTTGTVTSVAAGSYLTGGTITTSGTLAVDATSANTASKVVARDASGNFSAGTITAALSGNATSATTATTLATGHTIGMTGDVTYTSGSFNGSADVTGTATLANSGVTAGTYTNATVTVDAKGRVTSASSGGGSSGTVTSVAVSGTNITVSGSPITTSGTISISIPQAITTTSSVQFGSFGVGTAASGTSGEIRATNNITAYYSSDANLKENVRDIPNALNTVLAIGGKLFDWKDSYIEQHGGEDGYFVRKSDFGVIAQDVQKVFPIAVRTRDDGTLAVDYEKLCALAFSAIIELANEVRK